MSDFEIKVDSSRLTLRLNSMDANIRSSLQATSRTLEEELVALAQSRAPVRTGRYRDSIKGSVRSTQSTVTGIVDSKSALAAIIESGAHIPPHEILPNAAKALHFTGGSAGEVFAARVHSPGATLPAHDVIHGAFAEMQPEIEASLEMAVKSAAQAS